MLKRIFFTFQASFLVAILTLILTLVTTRFLGAYGRGYISIIATYLGIIQLITGIIGPGTLPYLLRRFNYSSIFSLAILWSATVSILTTFFLNRIGFLDNNISTVFILNAFTGSIFLLNVRMLISAKKLKWYNILIVIQPIIILICLFAFGVNDFDTKDFFYYQFISYSVGVFTSGLILKDKIFLGFTLTELKALLISAFSLGAFNQFSSFTQLLNYRFSFFFLEKLSGLRSVGIFSIILSFANVIWLFATTAGNLIGDEMNKSVDNKKSGIALIDKYLKLSLIISFVFIFICIITPSSFYVYLLNDDFKEINYYLLMFSPAIFIFSIAKVLAFYFSSLGKVKINFLSSAMGMIPTALGFWFVKFFDLNGVIISTTLSFLVSTSVLLFYYKKIKTENITI